jgi:hypothetical protein
MAPAALYRAVEDFSESLSSLGSSDRDQRSMEDSGKWKTVNVSLRVMSPT